MKHTGPLWEDFEHLEARISKIEDELSRMRSLPTPAPTPVYPPPPAWLDLEQRVIKIRGQVPKRLSEMEYRFIEILSRRAGKWVTSADIARHVWEQKRPADPSHSVRNLVWVTKKTIACTGYVIDHRYGGSYQLREASLDLENRAPAARAGACA